MNAMIGYYTNLMFYGYKFNLAYCHWFVLIFFFVVVVSKFVEQDNYRKETPEQFDRHKFIYWREYVKKKPNMNQSKKTNKK